MLVDLDETLFLRNSTEEFINCAAPGLLALLLMRLLDVVKPWRLTGGNVTRDVWRVGLVLCLFPWTTFIWKRRAKLLAQQHINKPLTNALLSTGQMPVIVTVGFATIVTPLVKQFGLKDARIVSCKLSFKSRLNGKLEMANTALGEEMVRQSLFITDSLDDLPMLKVCGTPLRVIWPDAAYHRALAHVYLPGQYLSRVKRPGERYIFRGILQEDFAFWLIGSIGLATSPLLHTIGLLFLLLSFWAIYERGYVDNDFVAAHYEASPKLDANYWTSTVATPVWQPWIWAFGSGALAILLLRGLDAFSLRDFVKWYSLLLFTYGWFKLYNRYDKMTRTWMFGVLQFLRSAAFLILVPSDAVGIAAVAAHSLARWVPYFLYRFGNKSWPDDSTQTIRLLFFIVLTALLTKVAGLSAILNWTAACLLAWNIFRARHELLAIIKSAKRIDREPWTEDNRLDLSGRFNVSHQPFANCDQDEIEPQRGQM